VKTFPHARKSVGLKILSEKQLSEKKRTFFLEKSRAKKEGISKPELWVGWKLAVVNLDRKGGAGCLKKGSGRTLGIERSSLPLIKEGECKHHPSGTLQRLGDQEGKAGGLSWRGGSFGVLLA